MDGLHQSFAAQLGEFADELDGFWRLIVMDMFLP
jgi:hypothetical protein